jgi:dTDP-4-amino-4,6-dideoxygalactose transaminase
MIVFNDTGSQWREIRDNCLPRIDEFLSSDSELILGSHVEEFERKFSSWNGNKYSVGVSSGTDAIKIALKSLNSNGVIIQANTWMSTLVAALDAGQKFGVVDCDEYHQMDTSLLRLELDKGHLDTVVVAHMYGHSCDMREIMRLKREYGFKLIEDCSQACGTLCFDGMKTGRFGDASIFSLHPRKNLGACGDAGIIVTDNAMVNKKCRLLRNLGSDSQNSHAVFGWNNRLDAVQAIILAEKIKHIDRWSGKKCEISQVYSSRIKNDKIILPKTSDYCELNSHYVYPILVEARDDFVEHMKRLGVQTRIQYAVSIENLKCFGFLNIPKTSESTNRIFKNICSIPLHPFLEAEEVDHIINSCNQFGGSK